MLYTIKVKYVDFSNGKSEQTEGDLILSLPQTTLAEARRNLFVKDLVRLPLISNYYKEDPGYQKSPESLLQQYASTDIPANRQKVRVVYKRAPELKDDVRYEFVFYIYFDAKGRPFNPLGQIEFTCRREYDVYYVAFMEDQLILGKSILPMTHYHEKEYVKVFTGADCQLAQVHYDDQGKEKAKILVGGSGDIEINPTTYPFIKPIIFTQEVLNILSAIPSEVYLNGSNRPCYEFTLANENHSNPIVIKIIWDNKQYYVLYDTQNGKQEYQPIPFSSLNGLQDIIRDKYHVTFVVNNIKGLSQYISKINKEYRFLTEVTDLISSLGANVDYNTVLDIASRNFSLPTKFLSSYTSNLQDRNYFK